MKEKKVKRILLVGYTALILYFMFLGFGRISRFDSFQYNLAVSAIPLWLPKHFTLDILCLWAFAMGNLMAFIPFGVLIPVNIPTQRKLFLKSAAVFLTGITVLEAVQMVSLLGSFDVEDILINALGFVIGYGAWRFSGQGRNVSNQILLFCIACVILVIAAIMCAEFINALFLR